MGLPKWIEAKGWPEFAPTRKKLILALAIAVELAAFILAIAILGHAIIMSGDK